MWCSSLTKEMALVYDLKQGIYGGVRCMVKAEYICSNFLLLFDSSVLLVITIPIQ